jgi:hypothetical protein
MIDLIFAAAHDLSPTRPPVQLPTQLGELIDLPANIEVNRRPMFAQQGS